ncbi:MAG: glycyl radical protein [Bacteroidales bacterium]|nr:glycyl radical protein [Bacteroidales bacterium]
MFEKLKRHNEDPERPAGVEGNFYPEKGNLPGMNTRIQKLREESVNTATSLSIERALIETAFYKENQGKYSIPVMRALNFLELCKKKSIYIGSHDLIVGERGEKPKAVSTFPELTCHSVEDLEVLRSREQQNYFISDPDIQRYAHEVIPFWQGRTQRERIFSHVPEEWKVAYESGVFTEFMEQRAPGHTCLDDKIYHKGMLDFKREIELEISRLDFFNDPEATDKAEQLKAMAISCDAIILLAGRHAEKAAELLVTETDPSRRNDLESIIRVCRRVPAHAPETFHEAIQMYWFVHLGTIMELNGWDAMNPGHFDQHLSPFYERDIAEGKLSRDKAKELLSCFWIKVNNQPAPPKVGITARESGTYNDFTNINIGGVKADGSNGVNEVSYLMLEVIEELHILQPGNSVHIASVTPNRFLHAAARVIRQGHGYPSVFNPDIYIQEMLRSGKSLKDAREGGCSGCIEVGAFGKEAYILTGYFNVPKVLEITLNNGFDPVSGKQAGPKTGDPALFTNFESFYAAFQQQLKYFIDLKIRVNNYIDRMYALYTPATFLSVVIDDCIKKGRDYYNGGPRYNTTYIQCTGLGTVTDSLSVLKKHVFEEGSVKMDHLLYALQSNFDGEEPLRQNILNHTPFYGNDDAYADQLALRVFDDLFDLIDNRPNGKAGGKYHLNMLSTTCHIYFGKVLGATPNGRLAGKSISDGTSPSHGCDTNGPTAVIKSLTKLDHVKTGGTLLNLRFLPGLLKRDEDIAKLGSLIRSYFALGGHHIQFNIVDTATLLAAREHPEEYRDLLVRMAGYSDYFNDMNDDLKQEVIERTENESF